MKLKFLQKNVLALLTSFALLFHFVANAQTTIPSLSGNSGNVIGTLQSHANESIYLDAEVGNCNFTSNATSMTSIGLSAFALSTVTTPNNGNAFSGISIYMKDVPAATTTIAAGSYSLTGYTLVYSGSITFAAINTWTYVNLTTPYVRSPGTNLQILFIRTDNVLHTGFSANCSNGNSAAGTGALTTRRYNNATAVSTSSILTPASPFRMGVSFRRINPNDAAVTQIYTLGKIPIPYATPHVIKANVTNVGLNAMTNIAVNLNVTGANVFSTSTVIPSLAVGASTVVSFNPFIPTNLGTNSINVSLGADDIACNNLLTVSQLVSGNAYTYAYGTVSNGGVGFTGATGDFVAKFNTNTATTVNQVSVNFAGSGQPFKIGIWDASVTGTPNVLLWESTAQTSTTGVFTLPVSPAVAVSGDFFVGVRQTGTVNVNFAYQSEAPIRPTTFYFTSPTGGTTWTDFAPNSPFKFMVEPRLTLANDVGVSSIVLPAGGSTIEICNTPITPSANVSNYGANAQTNLSVTMTIKKAGTAVFTDTQVIPSMASGASAVVTFASFNPGTLPAGTTAFTTECTTSLASDLDPTNDKVSNAFNVISSTFSGSSATYKYANRYACAAANPLLPAANYSWITQTASEITWAIGDDEIQPLTLPFGFSFFGTVYNTAYVSSNGWVSFTDPTALTQAVQRATVAIPTAGGIENYIAGALRDMDMTAATFSDTHLYYGGTPSQYVITYWHVHAFGALVGDYITFQIILNEDGSIKLQYNDAESTTVLPTAITNGSTVGIENSTASEGIQYRYLTAGGPMFGSPMAVDYVLLTPLPLRLLSFDAENKNHVNNLTWKTSAEVNTSRFEVERSFDGNKYSKMGEVKAINIREKQNTYTFTDVKPIEGLNYYRLKMIDLDGKSTYSMIRVINSTSTVQNVKVYPNPTSNVITTDFSLEEENEGMIQIFDALGSMVSQQAADYKAGANRVRTDVSALPAGIYFVKLGLKDQVIYLDKFVKQ